jgi:hypothetical protein
MGYADDPMLKSFKVGASVADNTDIDALIVPAGREILLRNLRSYAITTSPTANAKIELVNSSNTVLLSVAITQANGTLAEAAQTKPVIFTAGASDTFLKFRTDQATGAGCDVVIEAHFQYPGAE